MMKCGLVTFLDMSGLPIGVKVFGLSVPEVPVWRIKPEIMENSVPMRATNEISTVLHTAV
jgi:hypothetical protein